MIFCPRCSSPTLAPEISAMHSNRCDHCEELFFLVYEGEQLFTVHFDRDTQVLQSARCIEEHAIREVEQKFLGIFKFQVLKDFPVCEHCGQERESEWMLCEMCQRVLGLSRFEGDRILDRLKHLIRAK